MIVYRPIKTNKRTQAFGENRACVNNKNQVKTKKWYGCPVGYVSLYSRLGMKGHNGEDWAIYHREPIYFPVDIKGVKWFAQPHTDRYGGIGVDIISSKPINLDEIKTHIKFRFWHLDNVLVGNGENVKLGQIIGYGDNTGLSSGDHLHWSMKRCDKQGNALDKNNGYYGAIDFSPYFVNFFVRDLSNISALQQELKKLAQMNQDLRRIIMWITANKK